MDPVVGLFYKVELSNGKIFEAVRYNVTDNKSIPDMSNISFSILGMSYEEVKDLVSGNITNIKVQHCRPTSPPEYISAPEVIQEDFHEGFGANPSIEAYYHLGFTVKFFKVTEALLVQQKQAVQLEEETNSIINLYEKEYK